MAVPVQQTDDWRVLLLSVMGAPDSPLNVDALQWWADSEGTPAAWHNWLATTLPWPGSYPVNSAGVQHYPDVISGVDATWRTLEGSAYTEVVRWIRAGTNLGDIWSAVNSSPWCKGCQGGLYPVILYNHLSATPSPAPGSPGPSSPPTSPPAGLGAANAAWDRVRAATGRGSGGALANMKGIITQSRKARR